MAVALRIAVLSLLLCAVAALDECNNQYEGYLQCIVSGSSNALNAAAINPQPVTASQTQYQSCFQQQNCVPPNFQADVVSTLPTAYQNVARLIYQLWNVMPDRFKQCMVDKARGVILNYLQRCIQENAVSNFQMPAFPDLPLPANTAQRNLINQKINSTVLTFVSLMNCENAQSVNVSDNVIQCFTANRTGIDLQLCSIRKNCLSADVNNGDSRDCATRLNTVCGSINMCYGKAINNPSVLAASFSGTVNGSIAALGRAISECNTYSNWTFPMPQLGLIYNAFQKTPIPANVENILLSFVGAIVNLDFNPCDTSC